MAEVAEEEFEAGLPGRLRSYAQATFVAAMLAAQQPEGTAHKISTPEIVLGFLWAAVLDACGYLVFFFGIGAAINDVPIVDAIGNATFGFYIRMKGLPLTRSIVQWVAELIPGVGDIWPGYIVAWALTVWLDRHPKAAQVASVATSARGKAGKGAPASLGGKTPGIVRSVPGEAPSGLQPRVAGKVVPTPGTVAEKATPAAGATEVKKPNWLREQGEKVKGKFGQQKSGPTAKEEELQEGEIIPGEQTLFQEPAFKEPGMAKPYRITEGAGQTAGKKTVPEQTDKVVAPITRYRDEYGVAPEIRQRIAEEKASAAGQPVPSYVGASKLPEKAAEPVPLPTEDDTVVPTPQRVKEEARASAADSYGEITATQGTPQRPSPSKAASQPTTSLPKEPSTTPYRPARPWQKRRNVVAVDELLEPQSKELSEHEKALFENVVIETLPEQTPSTQRAPLAGEKPGRKLEPPTQTTRQQSTLHVVPQSRTATPPPTPQESDHDLRKAA